MDRVGHLLHELKKHLWVLKSVCQSLQSTGPPMCEKTRAAGVFTPWGKGWGLRNASCRKVVFTVVCKPDIAPHGAQVLHIGFTKTYHTLHGRGSWTEVGCPRLLSGPCLYALR
jgi:hypothetical protein